MTDLQATTSGTLPYHVPSKLDVAATSRAAWRVFKRQFGPYIGLLFVPLVVAIPVQMLSAVIQLALGFAFGRHGTTVFILTLVLGFLAALVQYGAQFTCQLAALWGTARVMEGSGFMFGDALRAGFGRLLPYFGLFIFMVAIILLGFLLLIVPGIIAIGFLGVAPAACVIERRGPIESMKRSLSLVVGNWWRSFAVFALTIFVPILAFAGLVLVVYIFCAAIKVPLLALIMILPAIPFFVVLGAFATMVPGVLFVELRAAKEGRTHGVASVFE